MVNKSISAARIPPGRPVSAATRRRRARGRPPAAASENVRGALLASARELFLRYGYRAVSSRQIAQAAGANVAMIRYYFGGKPGLYREMLLEAIGPLRAAMDAASASQASVDLGELFGRVVRAYVANPWIPGLILREVLSPEGPLRPMFIKEVAGRMAPLVEAAVRRGVERGELRADLDPRLAVLSLVSLAVFPFLAFPLTSKLFDVRLEAGFVDALAQHTAALLKHGIYAARAPESTS